MPKYIEIDEKKLCKLYLEGYSLKGLGEKYFIAPATVKKILVKNRIEITKKGERNKYKTVKKKKQIDLLKIIGFNEFTYGE